jgi:hypothetical protein
MGAQLGGLQRAGTCSCGSIKLMLHTLSFRWHGLQERAARHLQKSHTSMQRRLQASLVPYACAFKRTLTVGADRRACAVAVGATRPGNHTGRVARAKVAARKHIRVRPRSKQNRSRVLPPSLLDTGAEGPVRQFAQRGPAILRNTQRQVFNYEHH